MMLFIVRTLMVVCLTTTTAARSYDLRPFETEVLPAWIEKFVIDWDAGIFSYDGRRPALYGTLDAVHVVTTCGLNTTENWVAAITSKQKRDGWFDVGRDAPGKQPYHGAASAIAALRLLGAEPLFKNVDLENFAKNKHLWPATFDPLYYSECLSKKLNGSNNIHSCGQIIGAYPVILSEHKEFIDWWRQWIFNKTDPTIGVLCPDKSSTLHRIECIGGAMPTHGVELGLGIVESLPYPRELFNFALDVQNESGGAWSDTLPTDLGSLTLDGIFQVVNALASLPSSSSSSHQRRRRAPSRRRRLVDDVSYYDRALESCRTLLDIAVPQLNSKDRVLTTYSNTSHNLPNILSAVAVCATFSDLHLTTLRPWSCCPAYV